MEKMPQKEEVVNNYSHYFKIVKNVIVDTKLANEPSQDNFIKSLIGLMLLCLLTGSDMFISLVISVYPGYMSIKAVLSKDTEDDQRWLKYWIIVAAFMVISIPADWILSWAPGFSIGKKINILEANFSFLKHRIHYCQQFNNEWLIYFSKNCIFTVVYGTSAREWKRCPL